MKEFILFAVVCLLFWSVKGASWRDHVAGGVAGGLSTVLIYPIDTIKTVIQTKKDIHSVKDALRFVKKGGICNMYSGLTPALIGSIPSSALYFGTYELVKSKLSKVCSSRRHLTNIVASASGNVMSSVVFVPKETLKQQLQAFRTGVLKLPASYPMTTGGVATYIYETEGLPGFFSSFQATMLRNVPSTAIRFALYEELKLHIDKRLAGRWRKIGLLTAGAVASCVASAATTPFDVVKTRIATGLLPPGTSALRAIAAIGSSEGSSALFAGMSSRVLWSALYGGIGLTIYDICKAAMEPATTVGSAENLS